MSYEHTIIVGHLGRDPEMRYTPSGTAVTNFSVAVSRKFTGKDGKAVEKTKWFRVTAWGKLAETCNQYLAKGRQVLVAGEIDASHGLDVQKPFVRDVLHHEADLVAVSGQHQAKRGAAVDSPDHVAVHVRFYIFRKGPHPLSHDFLDLRLEAGRARRIDHLFEKPACLLFHITCP